MSDFTLFYLKVIENVMNSSHLSRQMTDNHGNFV